MHLRALIQGGRPPAKLEVGIQVSSKPPAAKLDGRIRPSSPRTLPADTLTPATLAIVATLPRPIAPTVATVATVAAPGPPESWPDRLRSLPPADGVRWDLAADALDVLLRAGVVEKALGLGWEARELVGVQRHPPHDHPSRAGLVFSMRPGDTVPDVRRAGCIIAYGTVRHIWKRVLLPADRSLCMPWELPK
jgi:hypothetical protein